jgi:hypothetical protein
MSSAQVMMMMMMMMMMVVGKWEFFLGSCENTS